MLQWPRPCHRHVACAIGLARGAQRWAAAAGAHERAHGWPAGPLSSHGLPAAARLLVIRAIQPTLQIVDREEKYGAHNYHPLPVVLNRGEGVFMCARPAFCPRLLASCVFCC